MKWYHSIITKISLIFLLAIFGVLAILFLLANHRTQKNLENAEQFARFAIHSSYNMTKRKLDFKNLKNSGLTIVKNQKIKRVILSRKIFLRNHKPYANMMQRMMGLNIRATIFKKKIYIILREKNRKTIVFKTPFKKETFSPFFISALSILLVILLYIAIIKNILPLYALKKKIKQFANGDYEIDCQSKNQDEIGVLANEFNEAVKKIKSLRDSRQLFLRNIMHELKTPIAKGKFAVEITQDKNLKHALQNIFNRQEYLIDEFARIEKLNANELQLDIKEYLLEDIIDFAQDILNHNNTQIIKNLSPVKLLVDFELFGTAIKNLLDNGINYSSDSKVMISNNHKIITISNKGEKLEFPLQNYAEPYFLKGKKQKSSRGLGFGLYIVWHILKLHNMKIRYKRENDINVFEILLK
ncbi:MAG: ArsS family sensor histidine kinase [Sulfurospirillum sp.]